MRGLDCALVGFQSKLKWVVVSIDELKRVLKDSFLSKDVVLTQHLNVLKDTNFNRWMNFISVDVLDVVSSESFEHVVILFFHESKVSCC